MIRSAHNIFYLSINIQVLLSKYQANLQGNLLIIKTCISFVISILNSWLLKKITKALLFPRGGGREEKACVAVYFVQ